MSPAVLAAVDEVVAEVAALDAAFDRLLAADALCCEAAKDAS